MHIEVKETAAMLLVIFFYVNFGLTVFFQILMSRLENYLKKEQQQVWINLGSPNGGNSSFSSIKNLLKFLHSSEYKDIEDIKLYEIASRCNRLRYLLAYSWIFMALMAIVALI